MASNVCDGCGAITMGGFVAVEIAPEKVVTVCASQRGSRWDRTGKTSCIERAVKKANVCPGCGSVASGRAFYGLCERCMGAIERGSVDDTVRRCALDVYLLSTIYPDRDGRDAATVLLRDLAALAAARGPRRVVRNWGYPRPQVITAPGKHREVDTGMPVVELDDDQQAAIRRIGDHIRALVDAAYIEGRRKGRDLLGGLASGDVSIADFADSDLKWRAREQADLATREDVLRAAAEADDEEDEEDHDG